MLVVIISAAVVLVLSLASTHGADFNCSEPPDIEFASVTNVTDEGYALGTIVTYACNLGYSFHGKSRTIFCDESDTGDGVKWSEPLIFCAPRSCGDPGYVNNGRRQGSRFTFPNFIKFECDEGYKIKGIPTRYCQTSGLWSGKLPSCNLITCNRPKDIDNGHVTYKSLEYFSELKYTCDAGFKLNTDETVFCTADGQWSKIDVECIESACDVPVAPVHGSVRLSDPEDVPRSGTVAIYACDWNRMLYGYRTSTCLNSGQWLFPTPECLSPCSVPNISNGTIGRYQRKYHFRDYKFNKILAGSKIEDDEELVLRCSEGYETVGSQNRESKISCSRGKWSLEPHCMPASCRLNPPHLENAEIVDVNPQHGGKVTYRCLTNFKKIKEESVVCEFGHWMGISRICESSRCLVAKLNFQGLLKGFQISYNDGELFRITCDAGYQVADDGELKCVEGEWTVNTSPCVPADCTEPPAIPHTKVEKTSVSHGSYATYVCEYPYKLLGYSSVQCLFGEWKYLPRCDDGRCDRKNLLHSSHISCQETPRYVPSGQELRVTCKAGYTPRLVTPYCLDGIWSRNSRSPCREDDCSVPNLDHGDIIDEIWGKEYFSFRKFGYVRDVSRKIVPFGTLVSPGTIYHLHCHSSYSFQGSSEEKRRITCTEGKWQPRPDCIPRGEDYNLWISRKKTTGIMPETTLMSPTTESKNPLDFQVRHTEVATTETLTTVKPVECSCEYRVNDEHLVANVDEKQLNFLGKVRDGSVVVFRCQHVGYHRFRGHKEIKCENCRAWHSSELPTCTKPTLGDAIIVFDNSRKISVEGNLEVRKGQNLTLTCIAYEGGTYPTWTIPTFNGVTFSRELKVREDRKVTLYMSHLQIENADLENEGAYNCSIKDNAATRSTVNVIVNDPSVQCPELLEDDEIVIFYDNERRVESKATISCKYRGRQLKGKTVLRCLSNGNWSDSPAQCHERKCKMLKETELLKIVYEGNREIGSSATFHCSIEGIRTGVATVQCMENQLWSHPTPTCDFPPCALEDLYSSIPKDVVPDLHNIQNKTFPYNTKVTLTCVGDLIALGDAVVKCEKNRTWQIQSFQCRSGCPPIQKKPDSKLKVKPEKDAYNFGDIAEFSCPEEMDLTTDLQQIICMKNGWSDTAVPDCKEQEENSPKPGT